MGEVYSDKWITKNGPKASNAWCEAILNLSNEQIMHGLAKCEEEFQKGNQWPCDLSAFLALVHGSSKMEMSAAYRHFAEGNKPRNNIEFAVKCKVGYQCRQTTDEKAERLYCKVYAATLQLVADGQTLPDKDQKRLPAKGVIKDRDIEIQNRAQNVLNGGKVLNEYELRAQRTIAAKRAREADKSQETSEPLFRGRHSNENFKPKDSR